jgi:hypothetical protein
MNKKYGKCRCVDFKHRIIGIKIGIPIGMPIFY